MIKIVIAEDHQALIDGINSYVEFEDDINVVGYANNGSQLLKLLERTRPHVVLCDIRMPKLDGISATKIISEKYPEVKVVAFTMFDQMEAVKQMLEAGAVGYVIKNSSLDVVLEAVRTVAQGKVYYDRKLHLKGSSCPRSKGLLSAREKQILQLIAQGKTSHQIADKLFIGKSTVDTHRRNMIRKLGLSGSGELMRYAVDRRYKFN